MTKQRTRKWVRNWEPIIEGDHLLIPLSRGKFSLIDSEDYDKVKYFNWSFNHEHNSSSPDKGYAMSTYPGTRTSRVKAFMSRIIMDVPDGYEVDHRNRNTLDNRKENLRICLHEKNGMNRSKPKNNKTGFKGVSIRRNKSKIKYKAQVSCGGKFHYMGLFDTPEEAHRVYLDKAQEVHKEYSCVG